MNVFICYRREDSGGYALAIYRELARRLDHDDQIFMDIDSIDAGTDFVEVVKDTLSNCDVALVLIGTGWLTMGTERWNSEPVQSDWVRVEVKTALGASLRVIPLLINQAQMPGDSELPEDIRRLCVLNALEIRSTRFEADVNQLIDALKGVEQGGSGRRSHPRSILFRTASVIAGEVSKVWKQHRYLSVFLILLAATGLYVVRSVIEVAQLTPYVRDAWDAKRPMGDHEESRLGDIETRISTRLEAALSRMQLEGAGLDPWMYADALVGLNTATISKPAQDYHYEFLLGQAKEDQLCWVQGRSRPTEAESCHLAATAWVLFAFAHMQREAPIESWRFVLGEQHYEGWWPLYQNSRNEITNASIYATALLTLAMKLHIDRALIADAEVEAMHTAISLSSSWLAQHRARSSCSWPDYPHSDERKDDSLALSGLVAFVLGEIGHPDHDALCMHCLEHFRTGELALEQTKNNSLIEFRFDDGEIISDTVNHLELVWSGIGVESCYESDDWRDRARARAFLTDALFRRSDRPDESLTQTWMLGETMLLLRAVSGRPIL